MTSKGSSNSYNQNKNFETRFLTRIIGYYSYLNTHLFTHTVIFLFECYSIGGIFTFFPCALLKIYNDIQLITACTLSKAKSVPWMPSNHKTNYMYNACLPWLCATHNLQINKEQISLWISVYDKHVQKKKEIYNSTTNRGHTNLLAIIV